jgi:hypothetical protein
MFTSLARCHTFVMTTLHFCHCVSVSCPNWARFERHLHSYMYATWWCIYPASMWLLQASYIRACMRSFLATVYSTPHIFMDLYSLLKNDVSEVVWPCMVFVVKSNGLLYALLSRFGLILHSPLITSSVAVHDLRSARRVVAALSQAAPTHHLSFLCLPIYIHHHVSTAFDHIQGRQVRYHCMNYVHSPQQTELTRTGQRWHQAVGQAHP